MMKLTKNDVKYRNINNHETVLYKLSNNKYITK
jgi:hypothetical protein